MKKHCMNAIIAMILGVVTMTTAYAKKPLWTFSLPSPQSVTVSSVGNAVVTYTVTNHSSHSKKLVLVTSIPKHPEYPPTPGLSSAGCFLPATKGGVIGTCTLSVNIDGSQIPQGGIHSGPYLCESSSLQQCYQPSPGHELNITLNMALYTVTPSGDGHETISPSTPQTVTYGATQEFTVTANTGYTLSNIVGGSCPAGSWSGNTYTTGPITTSCSVSFSATLQSFTVSASGDAHVSVAPPSQSVNYGSTGMVTLTVDTGYTPSIASDSCGGSLSGNTYITGPVTANCSVSFASSSDFFAGTSCGVFDFIDISTTGSFLGRGDDSSYAVTLAVGHPIYLYGTAYSTLNMSTNGLISSSNNSALSNTALPTANITGNTLFVLWDDLNSSGSSPLGLYYQYFATCPRASIDEPGEGCHVFQWITQFFSPSGPPMFSLEALVYDQTGEVVYQYGPGNAQQGSSSTTGVQNTSGSSFVQLSFNTFGSVPPNSVRCLKHYDDSP